MVDGYGHICPSEWSVDVIGCLIKKNINQCWRFSNIGHLKNDRQ